jgi:hypothetical protein
LSLPALFLLGASLFPSFAMNVNPSMAAPLASKILGDLSKNNPVVKELLTAILKAMEHVGAHKVTGRKQGVSLLSLFMYRLVYCHLFFFFSFFFVQPPWTQVADMLFTAFVFHPMPSRYGQVPAIGPFKCGTYHVALINNVSHCGMNRQ